MTFADEMLKLQQLKESGALSQEEFQRAKEGLMTQEAARRWNDGTHAQPRPQPPPDPAPAAPSSDQPGDANEDPLPAAAPVSVQEARARDERTWGILIHISQLFPVGGLVVPLVLWLIKREESVVIDQHGRVVLNWILSEIIYVVAGVVLCIVLIGIPALIALGIAAVVFPIIGAVKASEGQVWRYPLAIPFF